MSKLCDGLRGDAFVAAQEVGFDNLWIIDWRPCGTDTLINHLRGMVLPLTEHESKELFRQYCCPGGPLSRQNGESRKQHVSRRRRYGTLLTQMDPVIHLSEGHRSDMLLDLTGLTREERAVVQASITNKRDIDRVAAALIIPHPRIHLRESRKREKGKGKDTRRFQEKDKHTGTEKIWNECLSRKLHFRWRLRSWWRHGTLRNDDVQDFDTRWNEFLLSMTKIPSEDVLASLYKVRIRESDQLKNRIAQLSEVEDDGEKKPGSENLTPETRKLRQEQWSRVAGDLVVLEGDMEFACSQWKAKGQCLKGDQSSFRHERHDREKPDTESRSILWATSTKRQKCVEKKEPQRPKPVWEVQPTAVQKLLERYLH